MIKLDETPRLERLFRVAACISAYNEEKTIARNVIQAQRYVDRVLVCDDGSIDMTGEIAEKLGAVVLKHPVNQGYEASLVTLFSEASRMNAEYVITMDGDGEYDAPQIPRMLESLMNGEANIVVGSRFKKGSIDSPKYGKIGPETMSSLTPKLGYSDLSDLQSVFRAYDGKAIKFIGLSEKGAVSSTDILLKADEAGLIVKEIPTTITHNGTTPNSSSMDPGMGMITATLRHICMRRPLFFIGLPGTLVLMIGLAFFVWAFQILTQTRVIATNVVVIALGATMLGLILITTASVLWTMISVVRERI